jgi:hypothetical protein
LKIELQASKASYKVIKMKKAGDFDRSSLIYDAKTVFIDDFTPSNEIWIYFTPTVFYEGSISIKTSVIETTIS